MKRIREKLLVRTFSKQANGLKGKKARNNRRKIPAEEIPLKIESRLLLKKKLSLLLFLQEVKKQEVVDRAYPVQEKVETLPVVVPTETKPEATEPAQEKPVAEKPARSPKKSDRAEKSTEGKKTRRSTRKPKVADLPTEEPPVPVDPLTAAVEQAVQGKALHTASDRNPQPSANRRL